MEDVTQDTDALAVLLALGAFRWVPHLDDNRNGQDHWDFTDGETTLLVVNEALGFRGDQRFNAWWSVWSYCKQEPEHRTYRTYERAKEAAEQFISTGTWPDV